MIMKYLRLSLKTGSRVYFLYDVFFVLICLSFITSVTFTYGAGKRERERENTIIQSYTSINIHTQHYTCIFYEDLIWTCWWWLLCAKSVIISNYSKVGKKKEIHVFPKICLLEWLSGSWFILEFQILTARTWGRGKHGGTYR